MDLPEWNLILDHEGNEPNFPEEERPVQVIFDPYDTSSSPKVILCASERAPENDVGVEKVWIELRSGREIYNARAVAWRYLKEHEQEEIRRIYENKEGWFNEH